MPCRAGTPSESIKQWVEAGATKEYFNRPAYLRWKNPLGDWRDADDAPQGDTPYAEKLIEDKDLARYETWDVSVLVTNWLLGKYPNYGFLLDTLPGKGGTIVFFSREADALEKRPQLLVKFRDGRAARIFASADTFLDPSTVRALGNLKVLKVTHGRPALLRFDLSSIAGDESVEQALLQLHTSDRQYGPANIGVFRADPGGEMQSQSRIMGLAARYPQDKGLEEDPEVVLSTGFDNYFWKWDWSVIQEKPATFEPVNEAPQLKFEPLVDKALKVAIPEGSHRGLNMLYLFKKELGEEPEEIYFRYYLRFADDWNPTLDGGKLPGIAGTYDRAGWGGRRSDGRNGWSARGSFGRIIEDPDNPFHGNTPIGTYAYYANMPGKYGSPWSWSRDALGVLEKNRWYSIEQYVKLNTPGRDDGAMRVWIDGLLAMERTNIRHRDIDTLKIDRIWMNVYHGGTSVSPHLQHLFIDNVVIARRYIGPLAD